MCFDDAATVVDEDIPCVVDDRIRIVVRDVIIIPIWDSYSVELEYTFFIVDIRYVMAVGEVIRRCKIKVEILLCLLLFVAGL